MNKYLRANDGNKLLYNCWLMLFLLWVYTILSGNTFPIVLEHPTINNICSFIDSTFILNHSISFLMYYFNWIFVVYAIIQERMFKYKPLQISIMIFVFWLFKFLLLQYAWSNYLDFVYFGILAVLCRKKWYRSIIGCVLVFVFTFISSIIKDVFVPNVDFYTVPILISFVFSIDIYLMCAIYYLTTIKRKEGVYGSSFNHLQIKQNLENYYSSVSNFISRCFRRNHRIDRVKAYDIYCSIIFFCLVYFSLLIIGLIFNRWIEMTISVICFHRFRGNDDNTHHCETDLKCWCVSMVSFLTIMKLSLPIYISYILSILLAFALCIVMRIVYTINNKIKMNKRQELITIIGQDNLKNEDYIETLCLQKGLTSKYSETIYLYFSNTLEETASILGIDAKTVTRRINKFIKLYS